MRTLISIVLRRGGFSESEKEGKHRICGLLGSIGLGAGGGGGVAVGRFDIWS